MLHLITIHGLTFATTSARVKALEKKLQSMNYEQAAKLHAEMYRQSTRPAKKSRG